MPSLVLVPSPLHASRAARRLCDAQGGLLFGPVVSTLEALVPRLLAAAGDRRPVLPPLAERLLALEAGRAVGGPFAALAPASGLAGALASALAELRRGEVGAATARAVAARLEGSAGPRLAALAEALAELERRLEDGGLLDRPAATRAAAAAVRRGVPVAEARHLDLLVVDGLTAVSSAEWELLAALAARARRTRFQVPAFAERPDLSAAVDPLLRRVEGLYELAARREVELILTGGGEQAGRPAALLAAFGAGRVAGPGQDGEVLALAGEGEEGEAELAARAVARLADRGFDPGEVALVVPSPSRAAPLVSGAFAAAGVPLAAGRGGPLREVAAVRAVLDALGAATSGLDRRAAERLAASTYLASSGLGGRLGRLLDRAGAVAERVQPEEALRRRAAALDPHAAGRERVALRAAADGLAGLAALVGPLGGPATPGGHAARLVGFLDGAGVRRRAGRGDPELVVRDLAGLTRLEQAADELARALALAGRGAERLPAGTWWELLQVAVDGAALPATGQPAAGAVELWALADAPGLSRRAALVLGCARGAFPATPAPESVLREPERQGINDELGRGALATASVRRAEALHRAASALAAGREVVAIGWPAAGPGDGARPAPLVAEALRAVGLEVPEPPPAPRLGEARTAGQALAAAARLARGGGAAWAQAVARLPAALAVRAEDAAARGAVEVARREAVLARRAHPFAGRLEGAGLAALATRLPAEWSATTLEGFARCPFRLLLTLGGRLADPEGTGLDIDLRDEGRLLHAVLERWVAGLVASGAWPPTDDEAGQAALDAAVDEVFARFERAGRIGDPAVWIARRAVVRARLGRLLVFEAAAAGPLVPARLELAFGGRSPRPPLRLEHDGQVVEVQGRLDRIDASGVRLLVIDYKSGSDVRRLKRLLDPEAFGVESFQVPLYLLAAERELPGRTPSATYQLLGSGERLEPVEGTPDQAALAAAVVAAVGRVRAGDLPIVSRSCSHCPFGAVCRFESVAELADGEEA